MFYSNSYELRKIVKCIRHGRVLKLIRDSKETAGTICRKLVQKKASIKF